MFGPPEILPHFYRSLPCFERGIRCVNAIPLCTGQVQTSKLLPTGIQTFEIVNMYLLIKLDCPTSIHCLLF